MKWNGLIGALALAAGLSACAVPDAVRQGEGSVLLQIASINNGSQLISDVLKDDGVFNDDVIVSVRSTPKNPLGVTGSPPEDVFMERYEVRYFRSDGRNVEGVDVPFTVTGPLAGVISSGGSGDFSVSVVRHQAKVEPPLRNLRGGGGAIILTIIAEVTVHGRTAMGHGVSASGRLQIAFADFGG